MSAEFIPVERVVRALHATTQTLQTMLRRKRNDKFCLVHNEPKWQRIRRLAILSSGVTFDRAASAGNGLTGLEAPVAAHTCDGACNPSMEHAQQFT